MKWKLSLSLALFFSALSCLILPLPVLAADINLTFGGSASPRIQGASSNCGSADYNLAYVLNTSGSACTIGAVQLYGWNWAVSKGQFLELTVSVYNLTDNNALDAYFSRLNNANLGTWNGQAWVNNIRVANLDYQQVSSSNGLVHFLFEFTENANVVAGLQIAPTWVELKPNEAVSFVMVALYGYPNYGGGGGGTDLTQVIKEIQYFRTTINTRFDTVITNQELIYRALLNQQQHQQETINSINNINNYQEQATQEVVDNSQITANSSSQDALGQSQSLLEVFTGFVGAITSASPSTCVLDGNLGKFTMGQLNFCQDSPPAFVVALGSIISIAILVPLSYHVTKRLLSTIRSFQT